MTLFEPSVIEERRGYRGVVREVRSDCSTQRFFSTLLHRSLADARYDALAEAEAMTKGFGTSFVPAQILRV